MRYINLRLTYLLTYDSVYLTCSKKLTGSQLSPPRGTNKKLKCETKNKTMSMMNVEWRQAAAGRRPKTKPNDL